MIVVIPTNREVRLDYLAPLIDSGARFIVVDDSEGSVRVDHPSFRVFNWGDRRRILGRLDVGIPRRNGACRDFGFLLAWKESDDDEIIVALDDDCRVYHQDFASQVAAMLAPGPRPMAQSSSGHLNIIDLYQDVPAALFPRGFPYSARVHHAPSTFAEGPSGPATFSLGLWKNVFDINAIDKIAGPQWAHPDAELRHPSVAIAPGALVSVCSMNMQFRRRVLPAVYQLPMQVEVMPGWVVDRYGDIWGGFILKRLMDLRGDLMVAGEPMIFHAKDGNYTRNIWQEHVCHLVNDEFIALLSEATARLAPASYLDMVDALREELCRSKTGASPMLRPYLDHLVIAMAAWVAALKP